MTATCASNDIYNLNYSKGLRVGEYNVMPPVNSVRGRQRFSTAYPPAIKRVLILTYGDVVGAFENSKAPFFNLKI